MAVPKPGGAEQSRVGRVCASQIWDKGVLLSTSGLSHPGELQGSVTVRLAHLRLGTAVPQSGSQFDLKEELARLLVVFVLRHSRRPRRCKKASSSEARAAPYPWGSTFASAGSMSATEGSASHFAMGRG